MVMADSLQLMKVHMLTLLPDIPCLSLSDIQCPEVDIRGGSFESAPAARPVLAISQIYMSSIFG